MNKLLMLLLALALFCGVPALAKPNEVDVVMEGEVYHSITGKSTACISCVGGDCHTCNGHGYVACSRCNGRGTIG